MSARFVFRLQRLLALRERRESDAAVALVTARAHLDALHAAQADLESRRAGIREGLLPATGATGTVASYQLRALLLDELEARGLTLACAIAEAESDVAQRHEELNHRHRDRRVLERLRERQHTLAEGEGARVDRVAMDEVAQRHTLRHSRPQRDR